MTCHNPLCVEVSFVRPVVRPEAMGAEGGFLLWWSKSNYVGLCTGYHEVACCEWMRRGARFFPIRCVLSAGHQHGVFSQQPLVFPDLQHLHRSCSPFVQPHCAFAVGVYGVQGAKSRRSTIVTCGTQWWYESPLVHHLQFCFFEMIWGVLCLHTIGGIGLTGGALPSLVRVDSRLCSC